MSTAPARADRRLCSALRRREHAGKYGLSRLHALGILGFILSATSRAGQEGERPTTRLAATLLMHKTHSAEDIDDIIR